MREIQRPADRRIAGILPQSTMHRLFARSRLLRRLTVGALSRFELGIMGGHKQHGPLAVIRRVRGERESLLSGNESFMIHSLASAQRAVGGVMAEVGVFQGCSAKLISMAGRPSELHLFDTFEGLPEPGRRERRAMRKGHYAASLGAVRAYLADQPNLVFHKGLFTGAEVSCADRRFSFVHLDVDLKEGTRACLEFFYPRMLPGGIILSHDYSYLDGVREAFGEFLEDLPESAVELPSSQVMLIKAGMIKAEMIKGDMIKAGMIKAGMVKAGMNKADLTADCRVQSPCEEAGSSVATMASVSGTTAMAR